MSDEQEIFYTATELPDHERAGYLDRACGSDFALRKSVDRLLAEYFSDQGEFLERPACAVKNSIDDSGPPPVNIDDYVIDREIAKGAMGVVYKATQKSLGRPVALKMIRSSFLPSDIDIARFRSEAQTAGSLDHPNIVPIYEVGEEDGQHFFSMKLIEGGTLRERTDEFKDDPEKAARLILKIARAVQVAHQHGILHRDLKPGNILIDESSEPHVTDFGIARNLDSDSGLTQTGQIVGTLNYMAPEQAYSDSNLTTATDVYGLGAILYQLLTCRPPHQGDTSLQILKAIADEEPPPPNSFGSRIDQDLEVIVMKCLERNPTDRYGTAAELADELERWLNGSPIEARPVRTHERMAKWMRRKPFQAAFAATAMLLFLTLAIGGPLVGLNRVGMQKETEKQLYIAEMNLASQALLGRSGFASIRERIDRVKPTGTERLPWEWRFFDSLTLSPPVRFRSGAVEGVPAVCDWHPDGEILAVAGRSPSVRIFDPSGKILQQLPVPNNRKDIEFSSSGAKLAVVAKEQLIIFDTATWEQLHRFRVEVGEDPRLDWHPHSAHQIAVGGRNGELQVWQIDRKQPVPILKIAPHTAPDKNLPIGDICWSPDGTKIGYGGGKGFLSVVDAESGKIDHKPNRQRTMVNAVEWASTPFGELFSVDGIDARRMTWNASNWGQMATSENHTGGVKDLEFSPDGFHIASCSADSTVNVYQSIRRNEKVSLFGHAGPVSSISWHPDGTRIASVSSDGWVIVHSLNEDRAQAMWAASIEGDPTDFSMNPEGTEVALTEGKRIRITHLQLPRNRYLEPDLGGEDVLRVRWAPDGPRMLVVVKNAVYLVDTNTGDILEKFEKLENVSKIKWSPDGSRFAFSPNQNEIHVMKPGSGDEARLRWKAAINTDDFHWNPDGNSIVTTQGNNEPAIVFDVDSGDVIQQFESEKTFRKAAWNSDGSQLALASGRSVSIFDSKTGDKLLTFSGMDDTIHSLEWSPDDSRLLIEIDRPFPPQIWDPVEGKKLIDLPIWNGQIRVVHWSPDGERVLILERYHLRVMTARP